MSVYVKTPVWNNALGKNAEFLKRGENFMEARVLKKYRCKIYAKYKLL